MQTTQGCVYKVFFDSALKAHPENAPLPTSFPEKLYLGLSKHANSKRSMQEITKNHR